MAPHGGGKGQPHSGMASMPERLPPAAPCGNPVSYCWLEFVVASEAFLVDAFFEDIFLPFEECFFIECFLACVFALCFFALCFDFDFVIVVLAVVVLPLVETVVVALVLPDFVVTVFVAVGALVAATAGVAIIASAATELISFFIWYLLVPGTDAPARWLIFTGKSQSCFTPIKACSSGPRAALPLPLPGARFGPAS
jgi:hypothetical protein